MHIKAAQLWQGRAGQDDTQQGRSVWHSLARQDGGAGHVDSQQGRSAWQSRAGHRTAGQVNMEGLWAHQCTAGQGNGRSTQTAGQSFHSLPEDTSCNKAHSNTQVHDTNLHMKGASIMHKEQHPHLERSGQLDKRVCSSVSCLCCLRCMAAASSEGHLAK